MTWAWAWRAASGKRLGNAFDGQRAARFGVDAHHGPLQMNWPAGDAEFLRGVGAEAPDDRLDLPAQHAVTRTGESRVCQIGCPARENPLVRRLDVGVGADDGADLAVEHPGEGDF